MSRSIQIVSTVLLLGARLVGQEAAVPQTSRVEIRMLAFGPVNASGEWFAHDVAAKQDAGGVPVKLKSYLNHENHVMNLHGHDLVFTTSPQRDSIKQADSVQAKVTLPANQGELVLLFLPARQAGRGGWQVLAIDDSPRGFPPGSLKVLNLSHRPVRIRLEQENFDFKSGESKVIKDPPVGANHHSAMTSFAYDDGEWRRIGAGLWPHPGRKRSVQVLFDDPASGQVQLRGFRDVVEKSNNPGS